MFGLRNSQRPGWCLVAFSFVWVIASAGSALADKVTICHFPPGNHSKFVQITIDSAGLPAHLAHGDFVGECSHDCNLTPGLCSTPPDACHVAGTCNAATGLCQFPNQKDGASCVGNVGLGCDQCVNGACAAAADCNFIAETSGAGICSGGGVLQGYCDTSTHTCQSETLACPALNDTINPTLPSGSIEKCYENACDPSLGQCIQFCLHQPCAVPGSAGCGSVIGCASDADCFTGNACSVGSCSSNVCFFQTPQCGTGNPQVASICDAKAGCVDFPDPFGGVDCPSYFNPLPEGASTTFNSIAFTDSTGAEITVLAQNSNDDCSSVPNLPSELVVTSCGFFPNGCNQLQNTGTAVVTAADASGNQFPIQPGASAMICNSVPLVPSGVSVACNGCCTYTNTTKSAAPIQFSDANGISYLLAGGQEALVCAAVPTIPTGISQSCPPIP
jgi:hypothetical protein